MLSGVSKIMAIFNVLVKTHGNVSQIRIRKQFHGTWGRPLAIDHNPNKILLCFDSL